MSTTEVETIVAAVLSDTTLVGPDHEEYTHRMVRYSREWHGNRFDNIQEQRKFYSSLEGKEQAKLWDRVRLKVKRGILRQNLLFAHRGRTIGE